MKRLLAALGALLLASALTARAAGPEDDYIAVYYLIQQGDTALSDGRLAESAARYNDALNGLRKLKNSYPTWQTNVVNFRLNYLNKKLSAPGMIVPPPVAPVPAPAPAVSTPGGEATQQMNALQSQVQTLQANNATLQAKLREALSARPASVEPAMVEQAEARLRELSKENELLKASLADRPAKPAADDAKLVAQLRKDLEDTKQRLATESSRAVSLAREKGDLQDRLDKTNTSPSDTTSRKAVQKELDDARRKFEEQRERAEQLAREKNTLVAKLTTLETEAASAKALRDENALLRKQVADLQTNPAMNAVTNDLARRLTTAEAQIAALQSERDLLKLERGALETRVKQLLAKVDAKPAAPAGPRPEDTQRIADLEQQRDTLQRQLAAAVKELAKSRSGSGEKVDELATQLSALRAKLTVYEAKAIPFSNEELALFRKAAPTLASTDPTTRRSSVIPRPPTGSRELILEAQSQFARGNFKQAEEKYQQVLQRDNRNVYTLANLAAIQIEESKYDEAEKNLRTAMGVAPDDAYTVQMLGYLNFRRQKYDDALTYFSQAAQLNPDSAEVQNYLGVTLSHKGQRQAAETALRTALKLEPDYGSAHNNLAVIYATQNPPYIELARWHYQKALDAGHPRNLELEKVFAQKTQTANR